jgi:hypothetical protein
MTPSNSSLPDGTRVRTYPAPDAQQVLEGKFLHILCGGAARLLFATPAACRYHNQLLARFLADEGIAHHWSGPEALVYDEHRVKVKGGGRFRLDPVARSLELWDNSQAYGRFDERLVTRYVKEAGPPWSDLLVKIG